MAEDYISAPLLGTNELQKKGTDNAGLRSAAPVFLAQTIDIYPINSLVRNTRNARKHSPKRLAKLADSLSAFGVINPIVIDENNTILVGHPTIFQAQYQQNPIGGTGDVFRWEWFRFVDNVPVDDDYVILSFDTAVSDKETNDYCVCQIWIVRDGHYYLKHIDRRRLCYVDSLAWAKSLVTRFQPDALISETDGVGGPFAEEMRRAFNTRAMFDSSRGKSKLERAYRVTADLEQGLVHLPESAPWLDAFRREILSFPGGKHDDQVDALTLFLGSVRKVIAKIRGLRLARPRPSRTHINGALPVAEVQHRRQLHSIYDLPNFGLRGVFRI